MNTPNTDENNNQLLPEVTPIDINKIESEKIPISITPNQVLSPWRFWIPLLFQAILITTIPAQAFYTFVTGKTVILQTAPVDPYDFLRGYYQTLSYDISNNSKLDKLPGWNDLKTETGSCYTPPGKPACKPPKFIKDGMTVYVVLEAPKEINNSIPPVAWKPIRVSKENPNNLEPNQVVIKGKYQHWRILYGIETYYMPEDERERINNEINEAQRLNWQQGRGRKPQPFVVETRIDSRGNAIPISLWINNNNYRF